tara:strand:- start:35 stop:301 length:267 start_codon:yes stop_codon:yes gene_type:complete
MAIAKQQIKPMETALADTPRDGDAGPSIIYLWGMPVGFRTKAVFIKQAFLKSLPDGHTVAVFFLGERKSRQIPKYCQRESKSIFISME